MEIENKEAESSYKNLYKKIDATSKTRFNASRRFKSYSQRSIKNIVLTSLILILISLMQAYGLGTNIESKLVTLIQVFASITVLVYSMLIERDNYSNLSEKMYSCGSELGELKQKIHPHLKKDYDSEIYEKFRNSYYDILKLFETHSNNDITIDYLIAKTEMPETYNLKIRYILYIWIRKRIDITWNFLRFYFFSILLMLVTYWIWFGWRLPWQS